MSDTIRDESVRPTTQEPQPHEVPEGGLSEPTATAVNGAHGTPTTLSRRSAIGGAAALGAATVVAGVAAGSAAAQSEEPAARRNRPGTGRAVALITGTSSGFGRLIALTLARAGYEVYASMRDLHHKNADSGRALRRVADTEGLALHVVDIDIRSDRSVEGGVRRVLRRAGRLDVLVNNAGIYYPALLETQTVAQVQEIFETNVFGQLRMNRAVLPTLRRQGEGLVVQMTSGVGRITFPFQGAYNGAKWAMEAMTEVSRYELSQSGVDVVMVEPGAYPTDFIDNARELYRKYLHGLSRGDARRRHEYGELARRVENELAEASGPDPQEVADAVLRLAQTPAGQRPLRTLVGEDTALIEEINAVHLRLQNEIMGYAGYEDLISV
ncbi:SDR family oxidoreductase [Phytoactinopolyspora halotolerans]|uniref:SDR family oxidoreductase n=1 Tax=Phytoactinopolyspora halotolerans TaxID=1981512 RepID=A0A6L9S3Q3_9ACTN|nr:SDR family oxidoreductase [Phytoactinopolyspora halotolerans]NEE00065.1 SDR family oxidoreductase [Phytoactinopolyspora halotolerans]